MIAEATLTRPEARPRSPAAVAAMHTEHLATCSPRCRAWHRAHPGATGERRHADAAGPGAWEVAATVLDPEVPVLTIDDLGILRDVADHRRRRGRRTITPTYSGCPAMDAIRDDVVAALRRRATPTSASSSCCRRPGPPTG